MYGEEGQSLNNFSENDLKQILERINDPELYIT